MTSRIDTGQLMKDSILRAYGVIRGGASRTVIPGKENSCPAIMKTQGEDKEICFYQIHHCCNFWFPVLKKVRERGAQIRPVWKLSV